MANPIVQQHVPKGNTAVATSVAASWSADTLAGDRLLAIVNIEANGVSNIPVTPADPLWKIKSPPGRIARQAAGVDEVVLVVYEMMNAPIRFAASPEVFNLGASVFANIELLRISGADKTIADGAVPTTFVGAGLSIDVPNTAAATVDCIAILIAANGNPTSTQTPPGGWTLVDDVSPGSTGSDRSRVDIFRKNVAAGATPGAASVVLSGATSRNEAGIMLMIPAVFATPTKTTIIQSSSDAPDTAQQSMSVPWDQPTVAGNRLVMIVATNDESMTVNVGVDAVWGDPITPPGKVTQQNAGLDVNSIRAYEILNAAVRSGTETVTIDESVFGWMAIIEIAGSSTTVPTDVQSSGHGSSLAVDTGASPPTTVKDGIALAAFAFNNLGSFSPTDPYTPVESVATNILTGGNAPKITAISPASGNAGDVVTLTGTGFTGATDAFIGGLQCPTITVLSDTQMQIVVPSGAVNGLIKFFSPSGTGISNVSFSIIGAVPIINGFSPGGGSAGTSVTITGDNFTGASSVKFNGVSAVFSVVDDNHITATVPSAATNGNISVTVGGVTATSSVAFSVSAPPPSPIFDPTNPFIPTSGSVGDTITILGTNMGAITSAQVNGVSATVILVDATHVQIKIPAGATSGHVTLTNGGGITTSTATLTVSSSGGVITVPASRTRPGGEGGGGWCNVFEIDPLCKGHYGSIGDTWGPRVTLDRGNRWYTNNRTQNNWSAGRALYASQRPKTKGVMFYGVGAPHDASDGGGFLGYSKRGDFNMNILDGSPHGFANNTNAYGGTGAGSGPNGEQVRPNGEMIRGWYNAATDTEYIFTLTPTGVWRYVNGGADESAITGPTNLVAPADYPGSNKTTFFISSCFFDINHFVIVMWDHSISGTLQQSHVYMMKSGTGNLTTCAKSDIVLAELTIPARLTGFAEGAHVFHMNKGKDGSFFVGCGKGGAYKVALSGDDLTWTHISVDGSGNEFCDGIVSSVYSDSLGNVHIAQAGRQYHKTSGDALPGHGYAYGQKTPTGYNFSFPIDATSFPNGKLYAPGDGVTATGPVFSLYNVSDLMGTSSYMSDVRIDPYDDNIIILSGKSGSWISRQGPEGPWYPASFGQNGMETNGGTMKASGASAAGVGVADWKALTTTDKWRSAHKATVVAAGAGKTLNSSGSTTYGPADGCRSGKTFVFTAATSTTPAKLTINGVQVSDAMFEGMVVKANCISDFDDGTCVIGQFGGGVTVVDPTNNPAIPGLS